MTRLKSEHYNTKTFIEQDYPKSLTEVDLKPQGRVFSSPYTWRDEFLYFLLPDRFSNGKEKEENLYEPGKYDVQDKDTAKWMESGKKFVGGTINGIISKLDYLYNLGVTSLWVGPVFKQCADLDTYHGYGIQNFLDVDPRFGTRQELRNLVDAAHDRGMRVLLDIIYNHTGDVWFYNQNGEAKSELDYRAKGQYDIYGWRKKGGGFINNQDVSTSSDEDAVMPTEFRNPDFYTRAGKIGKWKEDPNNPDNEFRRGDFHSLKDINLNNREALDAVIKVYKYWIALTDCDGFRVDTVKHVPIEASRTFCAAIHEYAESTGKENFLILGEVADEEKVTKSYIEVFGLNIDAALDIMDPPKEIINIAKGYTLASKYFFDLFGKKKDTLGTHRQAGRYHVSVLDDHDMIGRDKKYRFSANNNIDAKDKQVAHAVGLQLCTLGIPCMYYGTEQAFNGNEGYHDYSIEKNKEHEDRYIREAMFESGFGAFKTQNCHFFNPDHPTYLRISTIAKVRKDNIALRRGRQYLRETCIFDEKGFTYPSEGEMIAWSRIMLDHEMVILLNTNGVAERGGKVTIDSSITPVGSKLKVLYDSSWSDEQLQIPPDNQFKEVKKYPSERAYIEALLEPAGMMILSMS